MTEQIPDLVIRTSEAGWLGRLAKVYKERRPVTVVDDENVGIDLSTQSLLDMCLKGGSPDASGWPFWYRWACRQWVFG